MGTLHVVPVPLSILHQIKQIHSSVGLSCTIRYTKVNLVIKLCTPNWPLNDTPIDALIAIKNVEWNIELCEIEHI